MDNAKKMILLDERVYNNLQNGHSLFEEKYQENAWSKPPEKRSKTKMHNDMHSLLENDDLYPDQKMKLYNQQFIRYQNTQKGSPMPPINIKPEPTIEIKPVSPKRSKRKQVDPKPIFDSDTEQAKSRRKPSLTRESESVWEKTRSKKKTKPRRSSRQRKPINWESLYDA